MIDIFGYIQIVKYENCFFFIMTQKIITTEEVQKITQQIDALQKDLEAHPNPITASILSKKYSELEELGFEYDVFNQELVINL